MERLAIAFALLAGCGGEVTYLSSAGAGGASGSTVTTTSGTMTTNTVSVSVGGTGGGSGSCGGFAGGACAKNEYCHHAGPQCAFGDEPGVCVPKPQACDNGFVPVCGCDGKIYATSCEAAAAGIDVGPASGCKAPAGYFACGSAYCNVYGYCEHQVSDVANEPDTYQCKPLPPTCGKTATCECVKNEVCGSFCKSVGLGQLVLTCPGG